MIGDKNMITLCLNNKTTKSKFQIDCSSYEQLKEQLEKRNIKNFKITKPLIKDQKSFEKNATHRKQVDFIEVQEKKKQDAGHNRNELEEKLIDLDPPLKKIILELERSSIYERPLMLVQDSKIRETFSEHFSGILYLFRKMKQLYNSAKEMHKRMNVDDEVVQNLIIKEYLNAINFVNGESGTFQSLRDSSSSLDWSSSILVYCEEYFDFPYPIFPFDHLLKRIVETFRNAFDNGNLKKRKAEIQKNPKAEVEYYFQDLFLKGSRIKFDPLFKLIGIQMGMEESNEKKWIFDQNKQEQKNMENQKLFLIEMSKYSYYLPCDFSKQPAKKYEQRLFDGFEEFIERTFRKVEKKNIEMIKREREINPEFDIHSYYHKKRSPCIHYLPKYLFIPINRTLKEKNGENQKAEDILNLSAKPKSKSILPINEIIDLTPLCSSQLRKRLAKGEYWRDTWFENLKMSEDYQRFCEQKQKKNEKESNRTLYEYFDRFLRGEIQIEEQSQQKSSPRKNKHQKEDLFDEFYFSDNEQSYATGDYRLIGAVLHKGEFFHNFRIDHLKEEKRKKYMKKEKNNIFSVLRIERMYDKDSDDSSDGEDNIEGQEDIKEQQKEQQRKQKQEQRKQEQIKQEQEQDCDYDDNIPDDPNEYVHDCRGKFQTIVHRRGKQWLKFNGVELSITNINEIIGRDKWGDGQQTPCLLMYQQIRFPQLQS